MTHPLRFVLVLHNHQPVGNFDFVIEQAYQDSYRPFLDVLDGFPNLRIALHTSGPLMEWLHTHHPEYVERLKDLVRQGRLEILGGAFYEPILAMLPARDRVGQIQSYAAWLERHLECRVRGMWVPERVWEPDMTSDIAASGMEYTVLDDFHFKNAGLTDGQLIGHYLTEDDGRLLSIFPGSEPLRYMIPFREPHETVDYLRGVAERHPGAVVVFGDDGEKFGTWPETKAHVYDNRWLARFFEALSAEADWLHVTTLSETFDNVSPVGKIYLPDSSYREMTEWVLSADRLFEYEGARHELEHDPRWPRISSFVRGGFWRNFKVKYPEANEMYGRMMMISNRLVACGGNGHDRSLVEEARRELYRGQCNCSYWHGAFGGVYLPHLRNAVYRNLIQADNLLVESEKGRDPWVTAETGDFNFDGRQEVYLASDKFASLIAPASGGMLYEWDVRSIAHNLLATMSRRPEAYHAKVRQGAGHDQNDVASIHDRVVFKQDGLHECLQYDAYQRKSLLDHFWEEHVTLDDVASARSNECGDFLQGVYETRIRRSPGRIQVQMIREGSALGHPVKITKGITAEAGGQTLEIAYLLEGLPQDQSPLHFGVEFNFAGLPPDADDRFFHDGQQQRFGHLGTRLDQQDAEALGLVDEWLGIDLQMNFSRGSGIWAFPVQTVSQSEGGFELVHQSVAVVPHWFVTPDREGRWSVTMRIEIDTSAAESRSEPAVEAAAS